MRGVGRVGGSGAVAGARTAGRTGSAGFKVAVEEGATAGGAAAASGVASLGLGLLALQEGGDERRRDGAARQRAESLLAELDGLQLELLDGPADPARLARMAALQAGEEGADPALRELVRAVALRVQVELARREGNFSVSGA